MLFHYITYFINISGKLDKSEFEFIRFEKRWESNPGKLLCLFLSSFRTFLLFSESQAFIVLKFCFPESFLYLKIMIASSTFTNSLKHSSLIYLHGEFNKNHSSPEETNRMDLSLITFVEFDKVGYIKNSWNESYVVEVFFIALL